MIQLTKEQAIKISEAHHKWHAAHPNATKTQLTQAFNKIRIKVLKEFQNCKINTV
jgi:hypothetical protein